MKNKKRATKKQKERKKQNENPTPKPNKLNTALLIHIALRTMDVVIQMYKIYVDIFW